MKKIILVLLLCVLGVSSLLDAAGSSNDGSGSRKLTAQEAASSFDYVCTKCGKRVLRTDFERRKWPAFRDALQGIETCSKGGTCLFEKDQRPEFLVDLWLGLVSLPESASSSSPSAALPVQESKKRQRPRVSASFSTATEVVLPRVKLSEPLQKSLDESLYNAAADNNILVMKKLLKMGASPNAASNPNKAKNKYQMPHEASDTPLHVAALNGHTDALALLLKSGGGIDVYNGVSTTPLRKACGAGHDAVVAFLTNAGADVNAPDKRGCSSLNLAVDKGFPSIVKMLIDAGADVNMADKYGCTALFYAASHGFDVIIELLLEAGANVNTAARNGLTPLHVAADDGHDAVVKRLLAAGADVNATDSKERTSLHFAATHGFALIVKTLLDAGAHINELDRAERTALDRTLYYGHLNCARILLAYGATTSNSGYQEAYNQIKSEMTLAQKAFIRMSFSDREKFKVMDPYRYIQHMRYFELKDEAFEEELRQKQAQELEAQYSQKATDDLVDSWLS